MTPERRKELRESMNCEAWLRYRDGDDAVMSTDELESLLAADEECERLRNLLWTPENEDFKKGVAREAAHQIKRWGTQHGAGKEPQDWFWLIGYLAGKALRAAIEGDTEKAKHHCISTAAVCANWHRRHCGTDTTFRPGISEPQP